MHTAIGRIIEHITQAELMDQLANQESVDQSDKQKIIDTLQNCAHYVIDDRIMKLIEQDKTEKSVKAMIAAGIRALPFDPMLLEFTDLTNVAGARAFVRLQTAPQVEGETTRADVYAYVYCMMKRDDGGYMVLSLRPGAPIPILFDDSIGFTVALRGYKNHDGEVRAYEHLGMTTVAAMLIAMLMLNTRGIATEHVSMAKLNKERVKHGKRPIRDYTVVRVGHIYDSRGHAHSADGTGRHMPVHWRSAHVRNVRYGPRAEPAKYRPVLIPACLVNFDPTAEGAVPLPHKEVTM